MWCRSLRETRRTAGQAWYILSLQGQAEIFMLSSAGQLLWSAPKCAVNSLKAKVGTGGKKYPHPGLQYKAFPAALRPGDTQRPGSF